MLRWVYACLLVIVVFAFSNTPWLRIVPKNYTPGWYREIAKLHWKIGLSGNEFLSYTISMHPDFLLRKAGHAGVYGLLTISLLIATKKSKWWTIFLVCIISVLDEFNQFFVAGRGGRLGDILIDVGASLLTVYVVQRYYNDKRSG